MRAFDHTACANTAVATTIISSVCPKCGIIHKSGKSSCCSRGGSWFGKCRGAGNANLGRTWYEGIQACRARRSQAVVGQQLQASEPNINVSSDEATIKVISVHIAANMLTLQPTVSAANSSVMPPVKPTVTPSANLTISESIRNFLADMFVATSFHTSASTSIAAPESAVALHVIAQIGMMLLIGCRY